MAAHHPFPAEVLISTETQRIETCLLDTLERSGLSPEQIDVVVRTGGSARIPHFVELLGRIFGPEKVMLSDIYSGVTAGAGDPSSVTFIAMLDGSIVGCMTIFARR